MEEATAGRGHKFLLDPHKLSKDMWTAMSETGKHERFCRVRLIVQGYISFESSLFEIMLKSRCYTAPSG